VLKCDNDSSTLLNTELGEFYQAVIVNIQKGISRDADQMALDVDGRSQLLKLGDQSGLANFLVS